MLNHVTVVTEEGQLATAVSEALRLQKIQVTTIVIDGTAFILGGLNDLQVSADDEDTVPYPECPEDLRGGLDAWLS